MRSNHDQDVTPSTAMSNPRVSDPRPTLRDTYRRIADGRTARTTCCGPTPATDAVAATYADTGIRHVPQPAKDLSLACGNPVGLAMLRPGQTVLDLGSGGGLDCFLAAERVGASGLVIGIDMTPEMLERARAARQAQGASNVEFRLGEIESLPVADGTVDVVLSNCVINLSPDKRRVFREAFRVLKPDGLLVVSDVMVAAPLPEGIAAALEPLPATVCVERDYLAAVEAAGFVEVDVLERIQVRTAPAAPPSPSPDGPRRARVTVQVGETGETRTIDVDPASLNGLTTGSFSATVRARKPS